MGDSHSCSTDCSCSHPSAWEPADNCSGCLELVEQYEAAAAALPQPLTRPALIAARWRMGASLESFAR